MMTYFCLRIQKASQKEAVTIAAQMLAEEPDSQVAMVMTKCDKTKSERTLDASQTQVHSALKQVTDSLDDVIYYRTSARTRRGVDELFRDIGEFSLVTFELAECFDRSITDLLYFLYCSSSEVTQR